MKKIIAMGVFACSIMFVLAFDFTALDIPTAKITNINADSDSVAVTYNLVDTEEDIIMHTEDYYPSITLSSKGKVVQEIKIDEGTNHVAKFDNLDSASKYTVDINVPYDFLALNEPHNEAPYTLVSEDAFTHKAKPTGEILETSKVSFNSIFVDTKITDVDNAITDTARLELVLNNQVRDTYYLSESSHTFSDLKLNADYTVNLVANYDADGNGIADTEDILSTKEFKTDDYRSVPTVQFNEPVIQEDSLLVNYNLIDDDSALIPNKTRIVVKQGEELIAADVPTVGLNQEQLFSGLEIGKYTVEITGQYDIDGDGVADNDSPYLLGSKDYSVGEPPTGSMTVTAAVDSLSVSHVVSEAAPVVNLELYQGDSLIKEVKDPSNPYVFNDLNPVTEYKIVLSSGNVILDTKVVSTLPDDVKTIMSCKDLESIGQGSDYAGATHTDAWELNGNYVLGEDISCHETQSDDSYGTDGFEPIGLLVEDINHSHPGQEIDGFSGSLNGNGYVVSGLYAVQTNGSYVGLIKELEDSGSVFNIGLEDVHIVGKDNVGAIAARNYAGTIYNSYSTGYIEANNNAGGLVGWNYGDLSDSYSTAEIVGNNKVGGLVGESYGAVSDSYFEGTVEGVDGVGGLIGWNYGDNIENSYAKGTINGTDGVGGLMGRASENSNIANSYFDGDVSGEVGIGGLVGFNDGNISNSYSLGNVTGNDDVGGLVGLSRINDVTNSYSLSNTNGGSLLGEINGTATLSNSFGVGSSKNGLVSKVVTVGEYSPVISNSFQYAKATCTETCNQYPKVWTNSLHDPAWYTDTLKFDENFNLKNINEGFYPHVMNKNLVDEIMNQDYVQLP